MFFFDKATHPDRVAEELITALQQKNRYFAVSMKEWTMFQVKMGVLDSMHSKEKFAKRFFMKIFEHGKLLNELGGAAKGSTVFAAPTWYRYQKKYREKDYPTLRSPWVENMIDGIGKIGGNTLVNFWEDVLKEDTWIMKGAARMLILVEKYVPGRGTKLYHQLFVVPETKYLVYGVPAVMYKDPWYPKSKYCNTDSVKKEVSRITNTAIFTGGITLDAVIENSKKLMNNEQKGVRILGYKSVDYMGIEDDVERHKITLENQMPV